LRDGATPVYGPGVTGIGRPGATKRQKERQRAEKQQIKAEKRAQRKADNERSRASLPDGVDPDIAGIVPGPQPTADDDDT
jgi:hypothetical protein